MTVRNAATVLTKREFADLFGVSEKQLERFFAQGMPHDRRSQRKIIIPMPAGREWYKEFLVKKGERRAQPTSFDEARLRREIAQARLEELKLAELEKSVMRVDEAIALLGNSYSRVRAKLLNLAPRAAAAAVGSQTVAELHEKIEPIVYEIMEELANDDDIPSLIEGEEDINDGDNSEPGTEGND